METYKAISDFLIDILARRGQYTNEQLVDELLDKLCDKWNVSEEGFNENKINQLKDICKSFKKYWLQVNRNKGWFTHA